MTTPSTIKQVKKVKKINLDLVKVGLNEFNYKNKSSIVTYLVQHLNFVIFQIILDHCFQKKTIKIKSFQFIREKVRTQYSVIPMELKKDIK